MLGCGEARGYGDQHAAGAAAAQGSTAEYRLVTLRLSVPSQQLEEQEGPGHKAAKALLPVVAYMILFDEQVRMIGPCLLPLRFVA